MSTPAIIYLLINVFGLGVIAVEGKSEVSFMTVFFAWIFVTLPLLYWGGFFG